MNGTNTDGEFLAVDFFCGAGGTSLGVIEAGFRVLAGIDNNAMYQSTYLTNIVNSDGSRAAFMNLDLLPSTHPGGQRDMVVDEIGRVLETARKGRKNPVLFIFCPPCQPFTSVNRGKLSANLEEVRRLDRGLLYHSLGYIRSFTPEAIFCENVSGIQDKKYGGVWQHFEASVAEMGYHVGSAVVDTVDFGIPQSRQRSILLAVRKDVYAGPSEAISSDRKLILPICDPNAEQMTVRQAIGHLPALEAGTAHPDDPDHRSSSVSDINRKRLVAAPEGGTNEHYMGTELEVGCHSRLRSRMGKDGRRSGGYTDVYTRLYADRPAPTITTKCFSFSNGRFGHYDRSQNRALSIREAACLQSFPDDYRFVTPSISSAAKMIGNAVPPKLARFYASYLSEIVGVNSNNDVGHPISLGNVDQVKNKELDMVML